MERHAGGFDPSSSGLASLKRRWGIHRPVPLCDTDTILGCYARPLVVPGLGPPAVGVRGARLGAVLPQGSLHGTSLVNKKEDILAVLLIPNFATIEGGSDPHGHPADHPDYWDHHQVLPHPLHRPYTAGFLFETTQRCPAS
ncbi:hypothetical protein SAY87_016341 [Trapa incisa]|uniref:Uncharacterized protein n=1 Tax=Trapa incisa TaxID=236973 RepID=A0AAN7LF98_9MYRT|nr:hypothetical protein SAY87_016341 [Trapa incisa]